MGGDSCDLCPRPGQMGLSKSSGAAKTRSGLLITQAVQPWRAGGRGRAGQQPPLPQDMTWRVSQGTEGSTWLNFVAGGLAHGHEATS